MAYKNHITSWLETLPQTEKNYPKTSDGLKNLQKDTLQLMLGLRPYLQQSPRIDSAGVYPLHGACYKPSGGNYYMPLIIIAPQEKNAETVAKILEDLGNQGTASKSFPNNCFLVSPSTKHFLATSELSNDQRNNPHTVDLDALLKPDSP